MADNKPYDQGRFEGEVLTRLDSLRELGVRVERCLEEHGKRITYLERQETKLKAYCTIISLAFSMGAHYLMKVWKA